MKYEEAKSYMKPAFLMYLDNINLNTIEGRKVLIANKLISKAVEKQIPKAPVFSEEIGDNICPCCGYPLTLNMDTNKYEEYCDKCGQHLETTQSAVDK